MINSYHWTEGQVHDVKEHISSSSNHDKIDMEDFCS